MANGAPTVSNGLVISGITTTSEIFVGNTIKLDPVSGISTFSEIKLDDNYKLNFGNSSDLQLWHNGNHSNIKNSTGRLYILADDIWIKDGDDGDFHARFLHDDASELYFNGGKRLETTNTGVTITGTVAATAFTGDGSNLTGIVGGKFNGPTAGILTTSTVGIQTADVTSANLVGAATSMVGLYIGDGHLLFSNYLNKSGGYYITTGLNALNAGPVTLATPMTLDGTWTIV
tara:strand:+ start:65 stop:757 length:693 start_codon:yes stop_codon:yes gene_type:complete